MTDAASVRTGTSMMVLPDLGPWREAWNELRRGRPAPDAVLTSLVARARRLCTARASSSSPRIVELVGGLALEERVVAGISFVTMLGAGHLCPDHLDLLARTGREDRVKGEIRGWLSNANARVVTLDGLVEGALVLDALPQGSSAVESTAPWIRVAGTDAYLATRSRNFRSNIRKAVHRAERDGVRYRHVDPTETSSGIERLRELHLARWGDGRFISSFDRFAAAAMRGAEIGEVSLRRARRGRSDGRLRRVLRARGPHLVLSSWSASGSSMAERGHAAALRDPGARERARVRRVRSPSGRRAVQAVVRERRAVAADRAIELGDSVGRLRRRRPARVRQARRLGARTKRQIARGVKARDIGR